jgi:hypothetical protein
MLPPPLLLTLLLALPLPRAARRQLLDVTSAVLSFTVLGGVKLVHFALLVSGIPLLDSGARTYRIARELHGGAGGDGDLSADAARLAMSANVRTRLLASKWREERNFWLAAMAFLAWALLTVAFGLVRQLIALEDEREALWDEVDDLKKAPRRTLRGPSAAARAVDEGRAVVGSAVERVRGAVGSAVERARGGGAGAGASTAVASPATRRRASAAPAE